jgi:hypothetical protein
LISSSTDLLRVQLIEVARQYLGVRYVRGGRSEHGFDCSGFVSYVYSKLGIALPRSSASQSQAGQKVDKEATRPVTWFFSTPAGKISSPMWASIWATICSFIPQVQEGGDDLQHERTILEDPVLPCGLFLHRGQKITPEAEPSFGSFPGAIQLQQQLLRQSKIEPKRMLHRTIELGELTGWSVP